MSDNSFLKNKEMVEKYIFFEDKNRNIAYFSSLPDEYKKRDRNFVRVNTIFGFISAY